VITNKGGRAFSAVTTFDASPPSTPRYLTLVDVNLDGKLDAVVAGSFDVRIVMLPGLGNGQFAAPIMTSFGFAGPITMLTSANLSGQARPEIIISYNSGTIGFLADNDTNQFGAFTWKQFTTPALHLPTTIEAADLNRDGKPDLSFTDPTNNWVTVALGQGNGAFAPHIDYTVPGRPGWIRSKDMNGDGMPDLVTGNAGSNTVSVLINSGTGTFSQPASFRVAPNYKPLNLVIVDMNNDFRPDVVTANGTANTVSILLNGTDFGPPAVPVISRMPGQVIIQWPASGGTYALEYTSVLNPSPIWLPLTYGAPSAGLYSVTNSLTGFSRFFRLRPVP
jgi:hypothetical protein